MCDAVCTVSQRQRNLCITIFLMWTQIPMHMSARWLNTAVQECDLQLTAGKKPYWWGQVVMIGGKQCHMGFSSKRQTKTRTTWNIVVTNSNKNVIGLKYCRNTELAEKQNQNHNIIPFTVTRTRNYLTRTYNPAPIIFCGKKYNCEMEWMYVGGRRIVQG